MIIYVIIDYRPMNEYSCNCPHIKPYVFIKYAAIDV